MENLKFEKKEELEIKTETITSDVLIDLIYRGKGEPQDKRFMSKGKGGVFENFDPTRLDHRGDKFYPIVEVGTKIVGLAELEKSPFQDKTFWLKLLSIDPEYQNMGYTHKLAEEMVKFVKGKNFTLETSSYNEKGFEKLKGLLKRLAEKYLVEFIDKEDK